MWLGVKKKKKKKKNLCSESVTCHFAKSWSRNTPLLSQFTLAHSLTFVLWLLLSAEKLKECCSSFHLFVEHLSQPQTVPLGVFLILAIWKRKCASEISISHIEKAYFSGKTIGNNTSQDAKAIEEQCITPLQTKQPPREPHPVVRSCIRAHKGYAYTRPMEIYTKCLACRITTWRVYIGLYNPSPFISTFWGGRDHREEQLCQRSKWPKIEHFAPEPQIWGYLAFQVHVEG